MLLYPKIVYAEQIFPTKIHNETSSLIRENSKRESIYLWNSYDAPEVNFVIRKFYVKQDEDITKFVLIFTLFKNVNCYNRIDNKQIVYSKINVNFKF